MCADEARKATVIPVSGGERRSCNRSRRASLLEAGLAADAIWVHGEWRSLLAAVARRELRKPGSLPYLQLLVGTETIPQIKHGVMLNDGEPFLRQISACCAGPELTGSMVLAMLLAVQRRCEMLGLRMPDVPVGDRQLLVAEGKGREQRVVPIAGRVPHVLGDYPHDERPTTASMEKGVRGVERAAARAAAVGRGPR